MVCSFKQALSPVFYRRVVGLFCRCCALVAMFRRSQGSGSGIN